jgi:hypothetical protein
MNNKNNNKKNKIKGTNLLQIYDITPVDRERQ